MIDMAGAFRQTFAQARERRADVDHIPEIAQHGAKPFGEIAANGIQEKGLRAKPFGTRETHTQGGMIE
jgi:hypothetical protein